MKLLKKMLPLCLLALALVITITALTPKAKAATANGTCGDNLTWALDEEGTLTISGTGAMYNWKYDSSSPTGSTHPWKNVAASIKNVVIESGVTTIGDYAFRYCSSLQSITIPDSVTSIGYSAFYDCSSLTGVYISDIAAWCNIAFGNSDSNPVSYAKKLYLNNTLVTELRIPDGVTSIGDYAFEGCSSLQAITIPDSVTSIGYEVFRNCSSLQSITIPDSVTSVGYAAFYSCSSLQSVTIGNGVTSIGYDVFRNCSSLTGVYISDIAAWCNIAFGNNSSNPVYYAQKLYLNNALVTELRIPDGVTTVGNYAFSDCFSLQSITIPDSVTSIGRSAFYICDSLQSITIPDSVTSIGKSAFDGCSSLQNVYYGGTQTQWNAISIGSDNSNLTNATIHYNHTHDYSLILPVVVEPGCTANGYIEYTCMYGDTYREVLPALGHSTGADAVVIAPTCTEQGYTRSACSRCGITATTDYTDALGHDYSGPEMTVDVTCTQEGYSGASCTRCDAVQWERVVNALGHNVVVVQLRDATCTEQGVSKVGTMCDRCQEVYIQPTYTPALGHNYTNGVCTACGEADPDHIPSLLPGDFNSDSSVDNNDVVLLLWHTLFPEEYPIPNGADLNHDNSVDNFDVVLLLWHTLFPEEYPL